MCHFLDDDNISLPLCFGQNGSCVYYVHMFFYIMMCRKVLILHKEIHKKGEPFIGHIGVSYQVTYDGSKEKVQGHLIMAIAPCKAPKKKIQKSLFGSPNPIVIFFKLWLLEFKNYNKLPNTYLSMYINTKFGSIPPPKP